MTIAIGLILVVVAIAIVGWPLLRGPRDEEQPQPEENYETNDLLAEKEKLFSAISELSSDYEMGSLSRHDYSELRQKYEEKAVSLMQELDNLAVGQDEAGPGEVDEIEEEVSRLRQGRVSGNSKSRAECARCGAVMDSADRFCVRCGSPAVQGCPACGAEIDTSDSFCTRCGQPLARQAKG